MGLEFKPAISLISLPSLKAIVTSTGLLEQLVIVGTTFVKFALILKNVVSGTRGVELDASKIALTVIT